MIAVEVTTPRAASIALVLAASALVCTSAPDVAAPSPTPTIVTKLDIELDLPMVAQQEPPPAADTKWHGTCLAGEAGWPDMPATLDMQIDPDGKMHATGTLAFIDRRTRATLQGSVWNGRFHLHGHMTEVGGLGTTWKLELTGRVDNADYLTGTFIEVYPDITPGSARMCSFDWRR